MTTENKNLATTDRAQQSQEIAKKTNVWQKIRENGQTILIALVLAFIIRTFIAEPRFIPSDSMFPTLETGDRLVVEKISYRFHPPVKGDIIVFEPPLQLLMQGYEKSQAFIKRTIATPGQTVAVKDGKVYVDDRPLQEKYIAESPQYNLEPIQVPEGELFVMGDNRNNSNDSHIWGFLPQENVIGHAVFRFFPLSRFGKV
jgi:signal peptidase I